MDYLYRLIISPLEYIIEIIFVYCFRTFNNVGVVIILVSFFVCLITLPLYLRADEIQRMEKKKQGDMSKWVSHIRKTFSKDERFFIMQTYYKEQNYNPANSLRGSLSILIQIPVFIAAYHYLSNLEMMKESSFLFLDNLGAPDGMMVLGEISMNILPILMTLINIISGLIYTEGKDYREMIKIIGLAIVFLVLLYDSPSGLVLYWICNNLFSFFKNIILSITQKHPGSRRIIKSLFIMIIFVGVILIMFGKNFSKYPGEVIFTIIFLLFQIPLLIIAYKERNEKKESNCIVFMISQILLTILIGIWMPISAIFSSPAEFIRPGVVSNPIKYMADTFLVSAGIFLIWIPFVFYMLKRRGRYVLEIISLTCSSLAVIHGIFLDYGIGQISSDLEVLEFLTYPELLDTISMMVTFLLPIIIYFIWSRRKRVVLYISLGMLLTVSALSLRDIVFTEKKMQDYYANVDLEIKENKIPVSRTGKNVMILMIDKAINAYIPYMLEERPELKEKLDGFTYYPNTMSYAGSTYNGTQALYGGYEYTPKRLNEKTDQTLKEKQTESLLLLPVLFLEEGYEVSVADQSYAGYKWYSDLSIYEDYPKINAMLLRGKGLKMVNSSKSAENLSRNFLYYGIFRCVPYAYRTLIYDDGKYWSLRKSLVKYAFYDAYTVLENLKSMTQITDDDKNTMLIFANTTAHESMELLQPDYIPFFYGEESNRRYAEEHKHDFINNPNYHTNMCAILRVTEWFDYLKENGIWDNTRIIIVSDHGFPNGDFPDMIFDDGLDIEAYNPLLMIKDFGEKGFKVSDNFMTNADVPTIIVKDIIEKPQNPFTGHEISMNDKYSEEGQEIWDTNSIMWNDGEFVLPEGNVLDADKCIRYRVKNYNIFDENNWEKISK